VVEAENLTNKKGFGVVSSTITDFRSRSFDIANVDRSGKDVGRKVYWQLYCVENLVRVLVHSILSAQVGIDWWEISVSSTIRQKASRRKQGYTNVPWHSSPGAHEIYYIDLSDLNEIIRANSNLFQPVVTDVDAWIARIEQLRLPRNVVAHMNWPSTTDRKRIQVFHADVKALVDSVSSRVTISIPGNEQ
jgi:hypothetical protein